MGEKSEKKAVLVGDVGGTNTRIAVVEIIDNNFKIILFKTQKTGLISNFPNFISKALDAAKQEKGISPKDACFAVAGCVEKQKAKLFNAKLFIDAKRIQKQTSLKKVLIINDMEAIAYSIPFLEKKDLKILQKGKKAKAGVSLVVGAGTGLGKGIFASEVGKFLAIASEGGHSEIPLQSPEERNLADFIKSRRKKTVLSYELILSGIGIEDTYSFFQTVKYPSEQPNLPVETIFKTKKLNKASQETINLFIRLFARCCRNFALDVLPTKGVFISGGIAAKNHDVFSKAFIKSFISHDSCKSILKNTHLSLIKNEMAGILGAASALVINPIPK